MKWMLPRFTCLIFMLISFNAQSQDTKQPDAEPFSELEAFRQPDQYPQEVDRRRGEIALESKAAKYVPGDHYANWHWEKKIIRSGTYYVALNYSSKRTKLGIQLRVDDIPPVKSYAPRTARNQVSSAILGKIHIPESKAYPVVLLTGDQSNVPDFSVKGVTFIPAPEGELSTQGIDGSLMLEASSATTYSENLFYQPKGKFLSGWNDVKDWAEWEFEVSNAGEFEVHIIHRGGKTAGSKVDVLINNKKMSFTVAASTDTEWQSTSLGSIKIENTGEHKLAIIPKTKVGETVMDFQQVLLSPVNQ